MQSIDHFNLRTFDLNLVLAFDALMQDLSVTRAARRLRIQQPAMSHALATLRVLLDDPLFVRTGAGMVPTPRARALAPPLRQLLQDAQSALLSRESFDLAKAIGTFRIGINVQLEALIVPALLERLRAQAPGMRVVTSSVTGQTVFDLLDEGAIDLAMGYLPGGHAWHHRKKVYDESHVCCFRRDTLGHGGAVTMAEYAALAHGFVSAKNSALGYLEEAFASAGVRPHVVVASPNLMTLAAAAAQSPILITVTARAARRYATLFGLQTSPLPFELPTLPVELLWHSRTQGDLANEWLRAQVIDLSGQGRRRHPQLP